MKLLSGIIAYFLFVSVCVSYDMKLDTVNDVKLWTFSGSYFYSATIEDVEGFFPTLTPSHSSLISARGKPAEANPGIWFTKYISRRRNVFRISYKLSHALFLQGWIKFLSDPSVALVVKAGSNDKHLGTFYSDGKSWCDAVFNVGYESSIAVEAFTPEQNDYILIDKIIMGISANITQLHPRRKLNPCLLQRPSLREDEGSGVDAEDDENKRTGRMNPGESELEGREGEGRPNLSTSTASPAADATLEELAKFLEQEEPRPVSTSTSTLTSTSTSRRVQVQGSISGKSGEMDDPRASSWDSQAPANSSASPNVDCNCSCNCFNRNT